jgi:Ca2+-binding RTX toxin-like protein
VIASSQNGRIVMAMHETFTTNPDLAAFLGSALPNQPGDWFGSLQIWSGLINNTSVAGNPVVDVNISNVPGIPMVQAEVFGTPYYINGNIAGYMVSKIEWSLPGSATVLARYTLATPLPFALSVSSFVGIYQFVNPFQNGVTTQAYFDDMYGGVDSLIGSAVNETIAGGGGNDTITGNGGADILFGDAGGDTFIFRSGDGVNGETVNGGSETDKILAVGAIVNGDLFQTGGVDLTSVFITGVEELHLNGTEVAVSVSAVANGLSTFVGRTGFVDQLTITGVNSGGLATLTLQNWEAQDVIAVIGTANADEVSGTAGQDIFLGLGGQDIFEGLGGNDRFIILNDDFAPSDQFIGGIGNDVLQVDSTATTDLRGLTLSGIEVLEAVNGFFIVDGSDFVGAVSGTSAAPVVSTVGFERIIGNGNDIAGIYVNLDIQMGALIGIDLRATIFEDWNDGFYGDARVRITAGAQTQIIYCPNEETRVNGSAAAAGLLIQGGTAYDEIYGSNFADYIFSGNGGPDYNFVHGLNGDDFITGGDGGDFLFGDGGNDTIGGDIGIDTIYGGEGGDTLVGGAGNDSLFGENGDDRYYLQDIGDVITETATGGSDTILAYIDNAVNALNVERLFIAGTGNFTATGRDSQSELLSGNSGNNTLNGLSGVDFLVGNAGSDTLNGGLDNDHLYGGAGADIHNGGSGLDYARYDDANHGNLTIRLDVPTMNTGVAVGDTYIDIEGLAGGLGNDTVVGNGLANYLFGGGGADNVYGQGGADYLSGDAGGDNLWGGSGADQHIGGDDAGVDYARYDDANWGNLTIRLDAPASNVGAVAVGDTYTGIEGLFGGLGNDVVIGNGSANYLFGGGGNDYIDGRAGNDHLNGGAGADRFVFNLAFGATNMDAIADFVHLTDDIVLAQAIFVGIGATLDASEFQIGMADAATDRIIYNNVTGQLFYDSNGNTVGGMTQFASVSAGTTLSIADFMMV